MTLLDEAFLALVYIVTVVVCIRYSHKTALNRIRLGVLNRLLYSIIIIMSFLCLILETELDNFISEGFFDYGFLTFYGNRKQSSV